MIELDAFYLPPLPIVLKNCITYILQNEKDEEYLFKNIATEVSFIDDIFSIANKQYYCQNNPPTHNLKEAVKRIGEVGILYILSKEYYENSFINVNIDFFQMKKLYLHSVYVSSLAVHIANQLHIENTKDLLIAGLFHDIGLIARSYCEKDVMRNMVKRCKQNHIDFYIAEKSENNIIHDLIGKEVGIKLGFSDRVCNLINNHHTLEVYRENNIDSMLNKEIDLLILADSLAHRMKFGFDDYTRNTHTSDYFLNRLNLSSGIVAKSAYETFKFANVFNI